MGERVFLFRAGRVRQNVDRRAKNAAREAALAGRQDRLPFEGDRAE